MIKNRILKKIKILKKDKILRMIRQPKVVKEGSNKETWKRRRKVKFKRGILKKGSKKMSTMMRM